MANELELKLAVTPERLRELKAHPLLQARALGPAMSRLLDNTYYDTPGGALLRARIGLRIRVQDGAYIQTLKTAGSALGGLHSRQEWEVALPAPELDLGRFPDEALAPVLREPAVLAELRPVFSTRFTRHSQDLRLAEGGVAELALDEGEVLAQGRSTPLCELELELKSGAPHELFALARELAGSVPMSVANLSKAQRGYALAGAAGPEEGVVERPPRLAAEMPVSEAFAQLCSWAQQLWQAHEWQVLHEPGAGETAALAEAAARLRAILSLFSGPVTRRSTQALRGELSLMEELLAGQREAQAMQGLALRLGSGGGIWRSLPGRKSLRALLQQRLAHGAEAEAALRARLDSTTHAQAQLDFGAWLNARAWERDGNAKTLAHLQLDLGHHAHDRLNRVWRALHEALHGDKPLRRSEYQDQAQHLAKLRLAGQCFAALYPRSGLEGFVAPWRDLEAGLADLAELALLRELAGAVEGEVGAELSAWLNRQEHSLMEALEETRRAALKRKPYWLD
ncbi:MAG: CYTH and CHAD domain-containing protein [Gammaproteobacteria bacterium]|nr:CYTH and CHAD domain-containing protein [Gammaproteobacteria bacterium]